MTLTDLRALPSPDRPAETARGLRPVAFAALTAVLIVLCVVLVWPFLPALAWGVALAVVAWPLQIWISARVPRRGVAAGLTTALVVLLIVVPGVFVAYQLAAEAGSATEQAREAEVRESLHDRMARTPALSGVTAWMDRVGVDIDREVHQLVAQYTQGAASLLQGSLLAVIQFAVAVFILFHLLSDREELVRRVRLYLPMSRDEADRVMRGAADSVHANLHATLVTSVIDGVGGGVMFWLLGLPSPVTWGVAMFFLSFLPLLGTWLVWMPAAAYLVASGQYGSAAVLLAWGVLSSIVVDNVIYVRVAGDRMRLHQVPALLAFIGGLAVFGASGMVLGPGILAVTVAVLDVWHRRANGETAAAPEPVKEEPPAAEPVWPDGHPPLIEPHPAV